MSVEILLTVLSGVASMLAGGFAFSRLLEVALRKVLRRPQPARPVSFADRMGALTSNLLQATAEVDSVLAEVAQVSRDRAAAVSKLETQVAELADREQALQERIDALQCLPLPVAEHFAQLTKAGEQRSARRDYLLFGAGVLVSTVISIVFFLIQGKR